MLLKAAEADPTDIDGYFILGRTFVRLEQYEQALQPLLTYVAYRADDHRGWSDLGRTQLEVGDQPPAAFSLNQALTIKADYSPAYIGRGWLNLELGGLSKLDSRTSRRRFNSGKRLFEMYLGLGHAYYLLGNLQEGLNQASTAMTIAGTSQ